MATFRQRGTQWEAQIRRKGYPTQSKSFAKKYEATAWANMVESEMTRGVWLPSREARDTTLGEAVNRYIKEISPKKKGHSSEVSMFRALIGNEETGVKPHPLVTRTMDSIRGADIAMLRDEWLAGASGPTVLRRLQLLSSVFSVARKEWRMETLLNPVEMVNLPEPSRPRDRRIQDRFRRAGPNDERPDELGEILRQTKSLVLPVWAILAIESAARRGELAALSWEDLDLDNCAALLRDTKNGLSRTIPLSSRARDAISRHWSNRGEPATGRVLGVRADSLTQAWGRARSRARVTYEDKCMAVGIAPDPDYIIGLRVHDLRHEATSRIASMFEMHELAAITGHRDPRTMQRYYHPRARDLAARIDDGTPRKKSS